MNASNCEHLLNIEHLDYHPGGTCLRVETFTPSARCALKPTDHARSRGINVYRWVASGGSPISICRPCSRNCPLKVEAEGGIMNNGKSGPCPVCQKLNRREGYGEVKCKECDLVYQLVKGLE